MTNTYVSILKAAHDALETLGMDIDEAMEPKYPNGTLINAKCPKERKRLAASQVDNAIVDAYMQAVKPLAEYYSAAASKEAWMDWYIKENGTLQEAAETVKGTLQYLWRKANSTVNLVRAELTIDEMEAVRVTLANVLQVDRNMPHADWVAINTLHNAAREALGMEIK